MKNRLYEPVKKMNNDRSGQRIEPMYFGLLLKLKLRRLFYFHKIRNRGFCEKQAERKTCRRDSGRSFVLSAGSTEGWKSFVPGMQRVATPCWG